MQGNGSAATPYFLATNAKFAGYSFGGKILGPAGNPLANYNFSTDGVLTPFVNGSTVGESSASSASTSARITPVN